MINQVSLINFKCYKKQDFDFTNLTVFCGNNSAGKSTVIQALLLALQNNFASELLLTGDFIQPGTYDDVHNRNADDDSLKIEFYLDQGVIAWGYEEKEFSSTKRKSVDEAPLPLLRLSNDELRNQLEQFYSDNFTYLTAERWGPRSYYPYSTQRRSKGWLGINGEYTAQVLDSFQQTIQRFHAEDPRLHPNIAAGSTTSFSDNLFHWMGEISPGVFIKASALKDADIATNQYSFGGQEYRAVNVGFGLSYVLPVVLALLNAKPGSLVIIENPEAHLHPKGQSYLGRLIALTAQAGVQVIIETHSDHVINGIRIMPRLSKVDCRNLTLYQVISGEESSIVKKIKVDEDGQLSEWPEEFFDQQLIDMDILLSGKEK